MAARKVKSFKRRSAHHPTAAEEKRLRQGVADVSSGQLDAQDKHFVIVVSRFNLPVTQKLLEGAVHALAGCGAARPQVRVVWVPGAFEIAAAARRAVAAFKPDAVVCLGAVVSGGTPHFDYICRETSRGIARAMEDTGTPMAFGVITADTMKQALERAGGKEGNKGSEAALTAVEMADLFGRMR